MKAVVCQNAELSVREVPEQIPQKGQALLKVLRCGICGCDLHMRHRCDDMRIALHRGGYSHFPSSNQPLVFGHEFCGEILQYGPGSDAAYKIGTRVCVVPLMGQGDEVDMLGLSHRVAGAYAERVIVQESMMLPVPDGLSDTMAALTEPMALALHAARRSEIRQDDVAVVMGCGPVGLAMVSMLKCIGVKTVVANDFSQARLQSALRCGADEVVNLEDDVPYANWAAYGFADKLSVQLEEAVATREPFDGLSQAWWDNWRTAASQSHKGRMPVIFECVGQLGVLQTIVDSAPLQARVVVVGVCRQPDELEPVTVGYQELDIRFAKGYTPREYQEALHLLAEGHLNAEGLVTGVVGLEGVDSAFDILGSSEQHGKILIDPSRPGTAMVALS